MKQRPKSRSKLIIRTSIYVFISIIIILLTCNWVVEYSSSEYCYSNKDSIPGNRVGLVLGTTKKLQGGYLNPYFTARIKAAAELYLAGKVQYLIVSGSNQEIWYNEPRDMKNMLVDFGIPDSVIYEDYAGRRTFDSIIRADKIFGQKNFTIISQEFHNERAVYIARAKGINAIAYNASEVNVAKYYKFKMFHRELLARVKVFIDIYVINKQPRFLGDKIEIK